jgi:hypothetical protein
VTAQAAIVIESGRPFIGGLMRIVTGKARKSSVAFSKAGAFVQVDRLVADVPGNIPIDVLTHRGWRPMTPSAEFD